MRADSGYVTANRKDLTAIGNVVVVSDSGITLMSSILKWVNKDQKIIGEGLVTLASDEDTLKGYQFESNKDLTDWKMQNVFGHTARDIDLRKGVIRSKENPTRNRKAQQDLDKELDEFLDKEQN